LVIIVAGVFGVGVMMNQSSAESPNVIRFQDSSILGPQVSLDGIQVLNLGQQAVITVNIEKVNDGPVDDIIVKAYLTNSENGKFLLIPKTTVLVEFEMFEELFVHLEGEEQLYQKQDITHPIMFQVIAINSSAEPLKDTIEVVLYLDETEVDRLSFDVIVKTKGI